MAPSVPRPLFDRREMLHGAGALGFGLLPILTQACTQPPASAARGLITGSTCPVTPRQTEGPFYFDPRLTRPDLAEGRPGVPLTLRLQVVEAAGCALSPGARVDVWHCDAGGAYSGYESEGSAGETFLRGTQIADADGVVTFRTLYPGWYAGRAVHIHCKAWLPDGREVASQLYFPEALTDRVHAQPPYAQRGGQRRRNEDDRIFRSSEGAPLLDMRRAGDGYEGAIVIALR